VSYEGYAPSGVAVIVECLTDNRNRTGAEIRSVFTRNGGSMAEPGAVSWQFQRKGVVLVPRSVAEDDLMLVAADAGAEDLSDEGSQWRVTCAPSELARLRAALEEDGVPVESADLFLVSTTTVPLSDEADARRVLRLLELLDDHDDVQNVWSNFDIPDAILELVGA
jgi:YebC/PmpR family DNA-binding regulatory protein